MDAEPHIVQGGMFLLWVFTQQELTLNYLNVSYKPDPFATYVDAFSVNWCHYKCYIFPLFGLMGRILQKIQTDKAEVLLVAPYWPTQPWFNVLQHLLVGDHFVITPHVNNLVLPHSPLVKQPLWGKLTLIVGILSGGNTGYDPNTVTLLLNSWRSTTKAGYATYLKWWIDFAVTNDLSITNPRTHEALKFLTDLYTKGCSD